MVIYTIGHSNVDVQETIERYLQVTGIYSFPDYLRGKTYCDLI